MSQDVHEQFVIAVCSARAVFVLAHRRIWRLSLGEMMDFSTLHDRIAAVTIILPATYCTTFLVRW